MKFNMPSSKLHLYLPHIWRRGLQSFCYPTPLHSSSRAQLSFCRLLGASASQQDPDETFLGATGMAIYLVILSSHRHWNLSLALIPIFPQCIRTHFVGNIFTCKYATGRTFDATAICLAFEDIMAQNSSPATQINQILDVCGKLKTENHLNNLNAKFQGFHYRETRMFTIKNVATEIWRSSKSTAPSPSWHPNGYQSLSRSVEPPPCPLLQSSFRSSLQIGVSHTGCGFEAMARNFPQETVLAMSCWVLLSPPTVQCSSLRHVHTLHAGMY